MTTLLFSVLAASGLVAAGVGAPAETRSAQSLPSEHLVVPAPHPASTGNFLNVNRLADAAPDNSGSDQSAKAECERSGGHWDDSKSSCRRRGAWPVWAIGAGTTGGLIYALLSGDGPAGQLPISH